MQIIFRKFTPADFADYLLLVQNEEVMAMITERAIPLEEAEVDFQKLILNNTIHPIFGNYKILNAATNDFLGLAKLEVEKQDSNMAELGYMLLPAYWGQGLGSIVAEELVKLATKQTQLHKLEAIIDPKNLASKKILLKNNFTSVAFKDFDGLPGEILEHLLNK